MANVPENAVLLDTEPFQKFLNILRDVKVYLPVALCIIIYLLHLRATRLRVIPEGIPWVGLRNEWFPKARANLRELFDSKQNIETGYQKVIPLPLLLSHRAERNQ